MEFEDEEAAKAELVALQRRYRHVEEERKQTFQKINGIIFRQEEMIRGLRREMANLQLNIKTAKSRVHESTNARWIAKLQELLSKYNDYQHLIGNEKQRIKELNEQIRRLEQRNFGITKKIGTEADGKLVYKKYEKKLKIVENQLYICNMRNNELLARNSSLRQEVDHLLKERNRFNLMYLKLSRDLMARKKTIATIVKQATAAYDQRDEAQMKINMLKERSQVDQALLAAEIKELRRHVEHNQELRTFMITKNQERPEIHKEEITPVWSEPDKEKDPEEKIRFFENAFDRLRHAAQESDIHNLVSQFLKTEEQNFVLFSYINELRDETERLEGKIATIRENLESLQDQERQVMQVHDEKMDALEEHLRIVTKAGSVVESKLAMCQDAMAQLKAGIAELCEFTECPSAALTEVLGGKEGINEFNILDYLTLLESYICELILLWQYISFKPKVEKKMIMEKPSIVESVSNVSSAHSGFEMVEPPNLGDFYWDPDDTDRLTKPLSRDNLLELANAAILQGHSTKKSSHPESSKLRDVGPSS